MHHRIHVSISVGFPNGVGFLDNLSMKVHTVDTYSFERTNIVTLFLTFVLHRLRAAHSAGFVSSEWLVVSKDANPFILAFWQSLLIRVGFFILTTVNTFVVCSYLSACEKSSVGFQFISLLSPLYGLMVSRYRRGNAFPYSPKDRKFRPISNIKLDKIK